MAMASPLPNEKLVKVLKGELAVGIDVSEDEVRKLKKEYDDRVAVHDRFLKEAGKPRAVKNPEAKPMPKARDMVGITYQQAYENDRHDKEVLNIEESEDVTCIICGASAEHFHSGGEVAAYVNDQVRISFARAIETMDITLLDKIDIDKLYVRCNAVVHNHADIKALLKLDQVYFKALQILREEEEDEAFYQQTLAEAARGPQQVATPSDQDVLDLAPDDLLRIFDLEEGDVEFKEPKAKKPRKKAKKVAKKPRRR
jgi:hypothetical protein